MTASAYAEEQRLIRAAKLTINVVEALQRFGQEARIAAENVDALTRAHHLAEARGVGVLAIREADGSLDCQPNVFVGARQVVIMEPVQFTPDPTITLDAPDAPDPILRAELTHLATRIIDHGIAA